MQNGNRRRRPPKRRPEMPDILYHATNVGRLDRYRKSGSLDAGPGRSVFLSLSESAAWEVAHRSNAKPAVLYVDAGRAWRSGVRFHRTRSGLWAAPQVPLRHVLNLRDHFREQLSAGGFLLRRDRGRVEIALVSCTRRSGTTWEIAKGKLEVGETPPQAAMRELQEEMGFEGELRIGGDLGVVRYGFQTPEGHPRLKSMHVYLIEAEVPPEAFRPADGEGINDVRWFGVPEAARVVRHTSLKPLMRQLLRMFPEREPPQPG